MQVAYLTDSDPAAVSSEYSASISLAGADCRFIPDASTGGFDVYASLSSAYSGSSSAITVTVDKTVGSTQVAADPQTFTSFVLDTGATVTLDGLPSGARPDRNERHGSRFGWEVPMIWEQLPWSMAALSTGRSRRQMRISSRTARSSANLAGDAALTMSGDGLVELTGTNSYTGGTKIGATTADTGTLAVGSNAALGDASGAVTFIGAGTLQALGDVTLNQAVVTPAIRPLRPRSTPTAST